MHSPSKILFLIDAIEGKYAGTEMQLLELIGGLDRRRFDPSLAVLRATPFVSFSGELPCPVEVLGAYRLASPGSWFKLIEFAYNIRRRRIRLVHVFFPDSSLVGPFFSYLGGARTVVARRDMGYWHTRSSLALMSISNRFADAMIANSEAVRARVHEQEGYPFDRIHVVHNGQDPTRFLAKPASGLRQDLGVGPDDPLIAMVANLRTVKRHEDLLQAFTIVSMKHPRAHLLLIGSGDREVELKDMARELGIDSRTHFLGRSHDVVPILKQCCVCVLCSSSEGLSNAVLEYLGSGCPVVCTDTGGNPELVRDGENGFLSPVGDPATLADRIDRVLSDPELQQRLAEGARETFSRAFTTQQMVADHMSLYDRLIGSE